jgi:hypothetical protein
MKYCQCKYPVADRREGEEHPYYVCRRCHRRLHPEVECEVEGGDDEAADTEEFGL